MADGLVGLLVGPVAPLHGLGGAKDLPIPAALAITGGTAALIVSFCVLVLAWRRPRYADAAAGPHAGRPLPRRLADLLDSAGWAWALRLLGLLFAGWFTWALVAGPDRVTNPVFGVFYVLLWVGIVPASLLFGRIFRALSPLRTINLLFATGDGGRPGSGAGGVPGMAGAVARDDRGVRLRVAGARQPPSRPTSDRCGSGLRCTPPS